MADNITLNAGSGGSVVATDDVGGAHYQYMKATYGADGTATPVDATNALPITFGTTSGTLAALTTVTTVTTVGTVSAITGIMMFS